MAGRFKVAGRVISLKCRSYTTRIVPSSRILGTEGLVRTKLSLGGPNVGHLQSSIQKVKIVYMKCLLACVAPMRRRNAQFLGTELRPRLYKIDSPDVGLLYESSTFWLQCGDMISKSIYLYKFGLINMRPLQYPYCTCCTLLVSSVM